MVPGIASDARAAAALSSAAVLSARAGLEAVELHDRLGITATGLAGALFTDGRVEMESIPVARRGVDGLIRLLAKADELLDADLDPRIATVRDAWTRARSQVNEVLGILGARTRFS